MPAVTNKIYFPNLDGLRTVACLMVFCFHALGMGHNRLNIRNEYLEKLLLTFLNGKTGVSIFFVLSGFLITYIILSEIKETGTLSLGRFYMRRVLRIWPLYFLILLTVFVLLPAISHYFNLGMSNNNARPLYYFVFLGNFDVMRIFENGGGDFLPSTITWSVAIEEQFYLFWPLLFFFTPAAYLKHALIAVAAAAFFFRLLHYNQVYQLYFNTISAAFDLTVGAIAAYVSSSGTRIKNAVITIPDTGRVIIITAGLVIMYLNVLIRAPWLNLFLGIGQALFFAFIIMDQCFNRSSRLKFAKSRLLSSLGKYTYGIYMIHPLVLLVINTTLLRLFSLSVDTGVSVATCFFIGLPLTVLLSMFSYNFIEKRFLTMKEKFSFLSMAAVKA